jgi:uncharacterized protein
MPRVVFESQMPVSVSKLWKWHEKPQAFSRLNPPFDRAELVSRKGGLEVGAETIVRVGLGPAKVTWVARHTACETERLFRDEQISGPFSKWTHTHHFEKVSETQSLLRDEIEYELPLGGLGSLVAGGSVEGQLQNLFGYRHAVTKLDVQRQERHPSKPLVFAITGATGLIARSLIPFLSVLGHEVRAVKRNGPRIDESAFDGADVVVNLAGAGVADERWTPDRKKLLRDSRIDFTRTVVEAMRSRSPRILIQGSAIGIYGDAGDAVLAEDSRSAQSSLLGTLCEDWEAEGAKAQDFGCRVVALRTGLVQSPEGGALAKLLPIFQIGGGGPVGNGRHWQSWISMEDMLGIILFAAVTPDLQGALNAVAPNPVTSSEYARILGAVLRRPAVIPAPAFALRLLFGEMAQGAILASQRVMPRVLQTKNFEFAFSELQAALSFALGRVPLSATSA